ncbi:stretch-activated Ca2+-permeable channel component-domain-containing protein [Daedaleopsis nitida]|nr:stretch-activated Ca2+-permeable channel component-domain-containing protein [Daedaleopsis nitida]
MLLPLPLLAVVQSFLLLAEAQQRLTLETIAALDTSTLPNPPTFSLLPSTDPLFVSAALCANADNPPRFFLSNDSSITQPGPGDVDNSRVFELELGAEGFGSWSGLFTGGGSLAVLKGSSTVAFEILVSSTNTTAEQEYPHVGDTTSNQALIFSPPFSPEPLVQPTYPNYTLPAASLSFPAQPTSPRNYTLIYTTTSSSPLGSIPRTTCALRAASKGDRTIVARSTEQSAGMWLRDPLGWRWQWLVEGLTPNTNYTAYMLQTGKLAATYPVNLVTKSASFNCPLVHNLPFCPSTSYAVPLAPPRSPAVVHTASTIPPEIADNIISTITNFTTTLTTLACGRDFYSPLVTCADCQQAYRTWLCAVSFPRCGEVPPNAVSGSSGSGGQAQIPLPALSSVQAGASMRNPALPAFGTSYQALLPCLETCNAADRACPTFLGFKCPLPKFTATNSYGVGFVDSGDEGSMGGGTTGVAQDVYGNVWCNAG